MARQKGILKVTGTLGGVNYYVIKGVGYARKAGGGFNGKAIRNKPSMQRVRENASEFGHCSMVKKAFRLALLPFLYGIKGRELHSRMMQLFIKLKGLDTVSKRGKRCVKEGLDTAYGTRMLKQFAFTPKDALFDTLYSLSAFDWSLQQLTVSHFKPSAFKSPKTATHVGITLGVLDFDFASLASSLQVSATYFLEVDAEASSFVLTPEEVLTPEHFGLAVLSLRFYEVIENEVYGLDTQVGMRLLGCLG